MSKVTVWPDVKSVKIIRYEGIEYKMYCDIGAFREGKCHVERARYNCPQHKQDICCIVCDRLTSCFYHCERINPDD